jgi:hypothetical protein
VRPMLKPALRRLWRDDTTLQLGIDPRHAVVLTGVGPTEARLLAALGGTLDVAGVHRAADELGVAHSACDRLLTLLAEANALDDAGADSPMSALHASERERLGPDVASLSLRHAGPGAAARVLDRRRNAAVRVVGAGRVGAPLAALLAAAGLGTVVVDDPSVARASDVAPGGIARDDVGLPRERAATAAVRRSAGEVACELAPPRTADLTVLAGAAAASAEQALLVREGHVHLAACVRETTGIVGPLVVPSETACLRCCDLSRAERDGAWAQIAAQLASRRERASDACDVALAVLVAAQAALQVLAYLDGAHEEAPALPTWNGTLEMTLPDYRWRRRSWTAHPACGCRWR